MTPKYYAYYKLSMNDYFTTVNSEMNTVTTNTIVNFKPYFERNFDATCPAVTAKATGIDEMITVVLR